MAIKTSIPKSNNKMLILSQMSQLYFLVNKRLNFNPVVARNFDSNSIYLCYFNTMTRALNGK